MRITTQSIIDLNPCERVSVFAENYPNFDGTLEEFFALPLISYSDKLWVIITILSFDQVIKWSISCLETVEYLYSSKNTDNRVIDIITYLKTIEDFSALSESQLTYIKSFNDTLVSMDYSAISDYEVALHNSDNISEKAGTAASKYIEFALHALVKLITGSDNIVKRAIIIHHICAASAFAKREIDPTIDELVNGDYSESIHANEQKNINFSLVIE